MFLNITADNWALLWSAVIGAIIAGGAAAGVAAWVLGKTRGDQAALAKVQLDEQRIDLERQLTEQRQGLELQLVDQRDQAQMTRRNSALADLAESISTMGVSDGHDSSSLADLGMRARTAILRWNLNDGDSETADTLTRLVHCAMDACHDLNQIEPDNETGDERELMVLLNMVSQMNKLIVELARADGTPRVAEVSTMLRSLYQRLVLV